MTTDLSQERLREIREGIEEDRRERAEKVARMWRDHLAPKDWLFDGSPIRGRVMIEYFNNLDWDNAWMDLGPSIAGNLGPYWHVPLCETIIDGEVYAEGDTVHRLYPKVLQTKWALLILHACNEAARASPTPTQQQQSE